MYTRERDRNHEYIYTVEIRHEFDKPVTDDNGNVKKDGEGKVKMYRATEWNPQKVQACNMDHVAGILHLKLDDIRYLHKEIVK